MTQSTTSDSSIFSFFLDSLCASRTAMKVNSQDDDGNSVSEGRSGDLQVSDFYFDFLPSPQPHYMCERDDEGCCAGIEYNERSSPPTMSLAKSYDGTHVTVAMTWESSFDLNEDAMSRELNCIQDIFEPNDEQFHSFSAEDTTDSNSIFRSTQQDYDHEQERKQYGTLVRMKHANYAHEALKSSPRIRKSKPLNDRPSSPPTYLKYPDGKAKEEARRQFVRHHIAEHHDDELHNLVMGRAA
jgi:hypothetical protein